MTVPPAHRRTSGLQPPFSVPQVGSWFLWTLLSVSLFLYSPLLPPEPFWVYLFLYFASLFPLFYYVYMVCTVDPRDPLAENSSGELLVGEDLKHCWICRVNVEKSTVHCARCLKCVAGFDHHCSWLNVCVGHGYQHKDGSTPPQENYSFFLKAVSSVLFHLCVHGISSAHVLFGYFGRLWNIREDSLPYPLVIAISSAVLFVLIFPVLAQLLVFHLTKILGKIDADGRKMTTYGFILAESRKRREKRQGLRE